MFEARRAERPRPIGNLPALNAKIGGFRGWRRNVMALVLGLIAVPAIPPANLLPLLAISFTGLVWLLDGAVSWRRAALDGWLFGMGFFVPCLYWVSLSMFVDIEQFWWMVPVSLLGLPALMSLYPAAAAAASRAVGGEDAGRILAFAACWTASEWLRGHLLTGFPWGLIGYAWSSEDPLLLAGLQSVSLFGIYGLGFVTVLLAALPACLSAADWRRTLLPIGLGLLLVANGVYWGRVQLTRGSDPTLPGILIRIVGTDIRQYDDSDPQRDAAAFRNTLTLAKSPGLARVAASIWPESSIDYLINRDAGARMAAAAAAPPDGVVIAGTLRANPEGPVTDVWNDIAVIDTSGALLATYDKFHLVPFGEYVPFRWLLPLGHIASERFDLAVGPGPETIGLPNLPSFAPVICYEAIFPHAVLDEGNRPGWIINVTNDAWFGRSIGPLQHFAIARVRAVEEGMPLARSANGGISAMFDPHGRALGLLPLGKQGVIDVTLPRASWLPTLYARWGDLPVLGFVLAAVLAAVLSARLGQTPQRDS